ncbi:MAG: cbb3-type cytochrome c oxidase subunit I, partial [Gemmataceae bacterium]
MSVAEQTRQVPPSTAALHEWISTVDHKKIGILYILMAVVFLIIAGIEALLMRWQLLWPRNTFLSPQVFNQMFTM